MRAYNAIIRRFEKIYILFYRWNLIKQIGSVGEKLSINGKLTIVNPKNLEIGSYCSLNHGAYINALNPITIGNDVTVSANVSIISTGIDYLKWFSTGIKSHTEGERTIIGNHVWIGSNATILNGVKISGEYIVIAANSVVTKDINEDFCVVAGCPAKIIKKIDL